MPGFCVAFGQWRGSDDLFQEYRYDALGRRVWTRTRNGCDNAADGENERCRYDTVRRSVWDGSHTLYEIRMPDTDAAREIDGMPPRQPRMQANFDPNPHLGRVLYTEGLETDAPLSVIRMGLADHPSGQDYRTWGEFAVLPLWDVEGGAPYTVFADGSRTRCLGTGRCLNAWWLLEWVTYGAKRNAQVLANDWEQVWLGSVLDDRQDASGLLYRRNRYYNPEQGRFTQEDPIGLAGGINLYGYASGDPVNFSDPSGLSPDPCKGFSGCLKALAAYEWRGFQAGADPTRTSINFDEEGQLGALVGRASLAFAGAGRISGAGSAASRAGLRILEHEGNHIIGAFNAAGGEARFVTEMVRSGDDLILRGTHIEGGATLREAVGAARTFGREVGVKRVIIEGGRRTTGANPGRIPRPIILETGL